MRGNLRICMAWPAILLGLSSVACGAAVPHQELTSAEAAVRAAEVGGAPAVPKAELHLKKARDQIAEAKKLIEEDENDRAYFELKRAAADAELALALAEENETRTQAQATSRRIQQLMEQ